MKFFIFIVFVTQHLCAMDYPIELLPDVNASLFDEGIPMPLNTTAMPLTTSTEEVQKEMERMAENVDLSESLTLVSISSAEKSLALSGYHAGGDMIPLWDAQKSLRNAGCIHDPDALINATPALHQAVNQYLVNNSSSEITEENWRNVDNLVNRFVDKKWVLGAGFTGGGLRGLIFAEILACLFEDHFKGKSMKNFFTDLSGTSTGGIYTSLASLGFSPQQSRDFYVNEATHIFPNDWRRVKSLEGIRYPMYKIGNIGAAADKAFAEVGLINPTLKHYQVPTIIPCFNLDTRRAFVFNSRSAHDFYARQVVEATAAAPTYFTPAQVESVNGSIKFIAADGGLSFNNPISTAMPMWMRTYGPDVRYSILSFGTGFPVGTELKYADIENASALYWLGRLTTDFIVGSALSVDDTYAELFTDRGFGYYRRFNTPLKSDQMEIDNVALTETYRDIGKAIYERDQDDLVRIFNAHAEIIEMDEFAFPVEVLTKDPIMLYGDRRMQRILKKL